jgi:drug/metabolite transporter (DMT)-like permease
VGLIILLVFSHFYLKERLRPHEWAAAAVATLGILGLGLSSSGEGPAGPGAPPPPPGLPGAPPLLAEAAAPGLARMVLAYAAMLAMLGEAHACRRPPTSVPDPRCRRRRAAAAACLGRVR